MKQRPRYAENRIAQELSNIFVPLGYEHFVRIPANGRTGPDITVNNTRLVVDAKSRVSNPKLYFDENAPLGFHCGDETHITVPIKNLADFNREDIKWNYRYSRVVAGYLAHMDRWRHAHIPDGITVVVLHLPHTHMPFGDARFTFYYSDIGKLLSLLRKEK